MLFSFSVYYNSSCWKCNVFCTYNWVWSIDCYIYWILWYFDLVLFFRHIILVCIKFLTHILKLIGYYMKKKSKFVRWMLVYIVCLLFVLNACFCLHFCHDRNSNAGLKQFRMIHAYCIESILDFCNSILIFKFFEVHFNGQ